MKKVTDTQPSTAAQPQPKSPDALPVLPAQSNKLLWKLLEGAFREDVYERRLLDQLAERVVQGISEGRWIARDLTPKRVSSDTRAALVRAALEVVRGGRGTSVPRPAPRPAGKR